MGNCGVGKSKLTNNICCSSQEVGIVKKSLTTFLYKGNCKYEKQLKKLVVLQNKPPKKAKQKKGKKKEVILPVTKVEVKHVDRKTILTESIVKQLILIYVGSWFL